MPAHCSEYDLADHYRDTHKHEARPGDTPAHRFDKPTATALEIAVLVKAISLPQAADLIEQYAATVAAEARLDQTNRTADRILAGIEAPLSRKEPVTP